jgi:hypothetical protein
VLQRHLAVALTSSTESNEDEVGRDRKSRVEEARVPDRPQLGREVRKVALGGLGDESGFIEPGKRFASASPRTL